VLVQFCTHDIHLLVRAFVVRPLVESNSVIWSTSLTIHNTERPPGLSKLQSYSERVYLPRLELHGVHRDLFSYYKTIFVLVQVNYGDSLVLGSCRPTGGHKYKSTNVVITHVFVPVFALSLIFRPITVNFDSFSSFKRTLRCVNSTKFANLSILGLVCFLKYVISFCN